MLEMRNVFTHYGKVECLKCVDFSVRRGEVVALLGANGAGKTTVLNTVCGLVRPSAGEVLFQGKNVAGLSAAQIVRLGVAHVPEGRRIFQRLNVRENLLIGAFIRGDREQIEKDLEKMCGLFPILRKRLDQKAGTLSGGEQQMLAIGRALMSRPSMLLLDEPSLGLAPILVSTIFRMIEEVHRQGMTILLVEQNARMALKVATRAYVLETGKVVLKGAASEIASDPAVREAYLGGG